MKRLLQCAAMTRFEFPHLPWWLMSNVVGDRVFGSPVHPSTSSRVNTYFIPGFCEWPGVFGKMKEFFRGTGRTVIGVDPALYMRPMVESAKKIEALVAAHLGEAVEHELIGHSRGALLALHVAKKLNLRKVVLLAPPLNGAPLAWLLPWLPSAREMIPSPLFSSFIEELLLGSLPERTIIVQGGRDGLAPDHYLERLASHVRVLHIQEASHIDLIRRLEVFLFIRSCLDETEPLPRVVPIHGQQRLRQG